MRPWLQSLQGRYEPTLIAQRVKDFFKYYAQNRHKATTLTPAYHAGVSCTIRCTLTAFEPWLRCGFEATKSASSLAVAYA